MENKSLLTVYNLETSQKAWEFLNEKLFMHQSNEFPINGGARYWYDMMINIAKPEIDQKFDFAKMFSYHKTKWVMLLNNYLDIDELKKVKADLELREIKPSSHFTHTLRFHNKKEGKECLISLTISKRQGVSNPVLVLHTRAIEVTKRFLLDLLLMQRISEYILPKNNCSLTIYCPMVYQDADTFTMYHNHRELLSLLPRGKTFTPWQARVLKAMKSFIETPIDKIAYKVNRRCAKQLQKGEDGLPIGSGNRKLLAKDLQLILEPKRKRKSHDTQL